MITKITTISELKQIFLEIFFNKNDNITDIGEESVISGIAYSCAKLAEKCLVNQSIIEGHIFPDTSYGEYLDNLALLNGKSSRMSACGSTTFVRVEAEPGTIYYKNTTTFKSSTGINFTMQDDYFIIGGNGFDYLKIVSVEVGFNTNVEPFTINQAIIPPDGHIACVNEYRATGGRDYEDDDLFRNRIKENINQLSLNTLSSLEQIFMKINPDILKIKKGTIEDGKFVFYVISVNGRVFSEDEFNEILLKSMSFLSISDLFFDSKGGYSLVLKNPDYYLLDIEFRVEIDENYDKDNVRNNIQIQMSKIFNPKNEISKIEWDDLLQIVKNTEGVRYVPDSYFSPNKDIKLTSYQIPRIRGFIMRDLDGIVIEDNKQVISSFYFPNEKMQSYQESVLMSI